MEKSPKPQSHRKMRGLSIIVIAALLLELLSFAQYTLTHRLLEGDLERRAESELTMKAILIKSTLNKSESILNNYIWKLETHLSHPDSCYITMHRIVSLNDYIKGAGVCFIPYYYPGKGKLYEVYAERKSSGLVQVSQIGGCDHDYTELSFYDSVVHSGNGLWSEPYMDDKGAHDLITTYSHPIKDNKKDIVVGVVGLDLSLAWLSDTIDSRNMYPSSFIMVVTENGTRVITPPERRINQSTQAFVYSLITDSLISISESSSGRSKVIHFDSEGRAGSIFYAKMKGYPKWKIAVVCYDDEVYASLFTLRFWFMLVMLLAFGILLYVVWRFARSEKRMSQAQRLLSEKSIEEERIMSELRIANGIQQALLPQDDFPHKSNSSVEVSGRLIPAKAVGGDLYNTFILGEKLYFCIGDVSGKGVPAALIMAVIQTMFRNIASREERPSAIMECINETSSRNNQSNMFATLFIGVLDLCTGLLRYCNAGHEIPILLNDVSTRSDDEAHSRYRMVEVHSNLPVGLFCDFRYEEQELSLSAGSTLFLYTDGLTEARNSSRDFFGIDRVVQMISEFSDKSPKEIVDIVVSEVEHFSDNTEQSDDLTLLAIRYSPDNE